MFQILSDRGEDGLVRWEGYFLWMEDCLLKINIRKKINKRDCNRGEIVINSRLIARLYCLIKERVEKEIIELEIQS